MPPVIYYLGGILVRATTKAIRDRLIAQGFRKATKGQINSTLPTVTGTENNLISLITRAKNAISGGKPAASGKPPAGNNKLGGSGQSAIGRKLGSRRMANFGKVRGGKGRAESMAKAKPPNIKITGSGGSKPSPVNKPVATAKPGPTAKANQQPRLSSGSTSRTVVRIKPKPAASSGSKIASAAPTIAGLVAAGAIGKVAYEAYVADKSPTVTQIKAAEKQIKAAAKTEKRNLENKRGFKPTELKKELEGITRKEPVRPKLRPKVVEAEPMSLRSYLNAEIKSRKSTVTKEKAKAEKGDYKSIAEAKKAKSLYYIKDGKPMAAVYKKDLKGL